jgi:large subunit ribosomal protein L1
MSKTTKETPVSAELTKEQKQESKEGKVYSLAEGIKAAKEGAKQRNFTQSWDLSISFRGLDLKKPENRFSSGCILPHGKGKDVKVAVFADSIVAQAKAVADLVIKKNEIDGLVKNKRKLKKLIEEYDWFLSEAPLLPAIVKSMGAVLGPKGKVPKPIPPGTKLESFVMATKKMVRITLRETPVIHVVIGNEKMPEEHIAANAEAVSVFVKEKLPKGLSNVKAVRIKLTMGPPVRVRIK